MGWFPLFTFPSHLLSSLLSASQNAWSQVKRGEKLPAHFSIFSGSLVSARHSSLPLLNFDVRSVLLNLCGMRKNLQSKPPYKNDNNLPTNVLNTYLKFSFPLDCPKQRLLSHSGFKFSYMQCFLCSLFTPECFSGLRLGRRLCIMAWEWG